jgi:4-oxalocrotonate tautomerase
MPIVEVKAFEQRFADPAISERLIEKLTNAVVEVFGEQVRAETWVVLEGVSPQRWGFGGAVRR